MEPRKSRDGSQMKNPYQVTRDFESALCEYTGAPYAVAVNSCTAALLLSLLWFRNGHFNRVGMEISIPKHTYVSVPMAIKNAGMKVVFREESWSGIYELFPLPIWDCARRFTSGMYRTEQFQCVSFAAAKILGIEQGGAILHDNPWADLWFRRMRFDGRTEGVDPREDHFDIVGHHCIMLPSIAAQGLLRLHHLPKNNPDMEDYPYPDLSKHPAFQ